VAASSAGAILSASVFRRTVRPAMRFSIFA
jgi:hypothetical protein